MQSSRSLRARLLVPAVTAGLMFALTISLGVWQVHRLSWKTGILAEIARGEMGAPQPVTLTSPAYSRVSARGSFLPETGRYGAEVRSTVAGGVMGAHVLGALLVPELGTLIVDRGWAPLGEQYPPPVGPITVEGYVRPRDAATWLSVSDDLAAHRFFTLDPLAIGAALKARDVVGFTLVMLGPAGSTPESAHILPRPSNDHLSYAITWFSLSLVLMIVFAAFVRHEWRNGASHDRDRFSKSLAER